MAQTLEITWTDPRGKVWDVGRGTEGVLLDLDADGLDWPELNHTWLRGDQVWSGVQLGRRSPKLRIQIGWSPATGWFTGAALYQLIDEWWSQANSPSELGTLTYRRPDGVTRSRRLRLAESPATTYTVDPGLDTEPPIELWSLTGDGPWWDGPEQTHRFSSADLTGDQTPYYGPSGAGWPLHISAGAYAGDAWIANTGQGPMWLTWTLVGPLTNPTFGPTGTTLTFTGTIPAGQTVEVSTSPTSRWVIDDYAGESLYSAVSGTWAPVPTGPRIPLTIGAASIGTGGSITAAGREQYARAF